MHSLSFCCLIRSYFTPSSCQRIDFNDRFVFNHCFRFVFSCSNSKGEKLLIRNGNTFTFYPKWKTKTEKKKTHTNFNGNRFSFVSLRLLFSLLAFPCNALSRHITFFFSLLLYSLLLSLFRWLLIIRPKKCHCFSVWRCRQCAFACWRRACGGPEFIRRIDDAVQRSTGCDANFLSIIQYIYSFFFLASRRFVLNRIRKRKINPSSCDKQTEKKIIPKSTMNDVWSCWSICARRQRQRRAQHGIQFRQCFYQSSHGIYRFFLRLVFVCQFGFRSLSWLVFFVWIAFLSNSTFSVGKSSFF